MTSMLIVLYIALGFLGLELVVLLPHIIGLILLCQNRPAAALPFFKYSNVSMKPLGSFGSRATLHLGQCYLMIEQYDAAARYLDDAIARLAHSRYPKFYAIALALKGTLLNVTGRAAEAQPLLLEALASYKHSPRYRSTFEYYLATSLCLLEQFEEAKDLLEKVLTNRRLKPDLLVSVECTLANCHHFRSDFQSALTVALRAAARPTLPSLHALALAHCLINQTELGDLESARVTASRLMPLNEKLPARIQACILRATSKLALQTGDMDRARDLAERAYLSSKDANAQAASLLLQASVFARLQNEGRVRSLCQEIARLDAMDYYHKKAGALLSQPCEPQIEPQIQISNNAL